MQLVIQSHDFTLTRGLETFIRKQSKTLLGPCSDEIRKLVVRLKNVRQPNGALDPQCAVEMHLPRQLNVVVIKRGVSPRATISRTLSHAGRAALQLLDGHSGWYSGKSSIRSSSFVGEDRMSASQAAGH